jgi:hypothetical protein
MSRFSAPSSRPPSVSRPTFFSKSFLGSRWRITSMRAIWRAASQRPRGARARSRCGSHAWRKKEWVKDVSGCAEHGRRSSRARTILAWRATEPASGPTLQPRSEGACCPSTNASLGTQARPDSRMSGAPPSSRSPRASPRGGRRTPPREGLIGRSEACLIIGCDSRQFRRWVENETIRPAVIDRDANGAVEARWFELKVIRAFAARVRRAHRRDATKSPASRSAAPPARQVPGSRGVPADERLPRPVKASGLDEPKERSDDDGPPSSKTGS